MPLLQQELDAHSIVDKDIAAATRIAAEKALVAGERVRAYHAFRLSRHQWQALGRQDQLEALNALFQRHLSGSDWLVS